MDYYFKDTGDNFRTNLFRKLVQKVDPYAPGYWAEKYRCFLRERDWRYSRKHERCLVHFDFSIAVKLQEDFFRFDAEERKRFKDRFINLANSSISESICHMWDYILGFDPFKEDQENYVDNFGLDLDFFSSPNSRWMLENMKRTLSSEVEGEINIKNKHSWHINEILSGDISPQERQETFSFRKPDHFNPPKDLENRHPGEYAEAVMMKVLRLIRRFNYPTHMNSPLYSPKDPENFSFTNSSPFSMVCEKRDVVIIMNEELHKHLSNWKDLRSLNHLILTVKTLPYECIKLGSRYRYNKFHVNKNLRTRLLDQNRKIEFLHRHLFNVFLRDDVPFMVLKIFGLREKLSPSK